MIPLLMADSDITTNAPTHVWYDSILRPIMWVVAWIMKGSHWFFSLFLNPDGGAVWVLSIVMLVVVMRVLMIPLFVKQIKSSRSMQMIQPELQKIQRKYQGKTDPISRQRQSEEMMTLYRKHGTNPFSSCMPILVQSPFFFALFRLLNLLGKIANGDVPAIGPIDAATAASASRSTLMGAPLFSTFMTADKSSGDASPATVRIVTVILIVLMSVTVFTTQRQLTMKNMPQSAIDNPMFRAQKVMLYMMPLVFAFSGINFPIGVLIYWLTTNLWSMGQQFLVIRNMPTAGSEAERKRQARLAAKRARRGLPPEDESPKGHGQATTATATKPVSGQRQQPKRNVSRAKRKAAAGHGGNGANGGNGQAGGAEAHSNGGPTAGGTNGAGNADGSGSGATGGGPVRDTPASVDDGGDKKPSGKAPRKGAKKPRR